MTEDRTLEIPTDGDAPVDPLNYLWQPYLPFGNLAILDGDPGVGKTYVALDLAARLTAGSPMPDGCPPPCPRGLGVVIANGDDVIEDTLLPRFLAAGGVRERLSFFGGLSRRQRTARVAEFPRDLPALVARIKKMQSVGLVIIDPISTLFPGVPGNNVEAVRRALAPFARIAAVTGIVFLFVRHLNKSDRGKSLYRGCGSIGYAAAVRTVLVAGRHPDDPDRAVLSMEKVNHGPRGRSLCYRIGEREGGVGVVWDGPSNLTAEDLCRLRAEPDGASRRTERWLHDLLSAGPVPAARVEAEAEAAGIGFATLRSVKKKLGVESRKVTKGGKTWWEWGFPESELPALPALGDLPPLPPI